MAQTSTGNTGTTDVTYNLVSILYYALQGAETYDQYISDAEQKNDKDPVQFFRDTIASSVRTAQSVPRPRNTPSAGISTAASPPFASR